MKLTINAQNLRVVLVVAMLLLIASATVGFILARNQLQAFAASISSMEADAASVDGNIEALKQLQVTLKESEDVKTKVNSVTVPASDYPVSVIANVKEIANQTGIKLTSINYGDTTSAVNNSNPSTTQGGAGTTTPSTPEAATPGGVTKKTVSVTVESPVDYTSLMNFIKGIESDDMYMHITKISMTKAEGKSVNIQPFTIEVYTK